MIKEVYDNLVNMENTYPKYTTELYNILEKAHRVGFGNLSAKENWFIIAAFAGQILKGDYNNYTLVDDILNHYQIYLHPLDYQYTSKYASSKDIELAAYKIIELYKQQSHKK